MIDKAGFHVRFWETPVDKDYGKFGGLYRRIVEKTRAGSILDFYITPR